MYRLICYLNSTLHYKLCGKVGDSSDKLRLLLFVDADLAGNNDDATSFRQVLESRKADTELEQRAERDRLEEKAMAEREEAEAKARMLENSSNHFDSNYSTKYLQPR